MSSFSWSNVHRERNFNRKRKNYVKGSFYKIFLKKLITDKKLLHFFYTNGYVKRHYPYPKEFLNDIEVGVNLYKDGTIKEFEVKGISLYFKGKSKFIPFLLNLKNVFFVWKREETGRESLFFRMLHPIDLNHYNLPPQKKLFLNGWLRDEGNVLMGYQEEYEKLAHLTNFFSDLSYLSKLFVVGWKKYNRCLICGRGEQITKHHFNPVSVFKSCKKVFELSFNKKYKKLFNLFSVVPLCSDCHNNGSYNVETLLFILENEGFFMSSVDSLISLMILENINREITYRLNSRIDKLKPLKRELDRHIFKVVNEVYEEWNENG